MASKQKLLRSLQVTIAELVGDLREHIFTDPREFMDLLLVEVYFSRLRPEQLMEHMVDKVLPHRDMIARRDERFFIDHPVLFNDPKLPSDRVEHYKNVWRTNRLSAFDKRTLWDYFDTIGAIIKLYAELEAAPSDR